jgi:hypothetical protein
MELQPSQDRKTVTASNETISKALQCTSFVLRRAQELAPDQQKPMLEIVTALIALEKDQEDQKL